MKRQYAVITEYRSKLDDDNVMVIHVGSNDDYMKDSVAEVIMDGKKIPFSMERRDTARSRNCYKYININFSCEYQYVIPVTNGFNNLVFTLKLRDELQCEKYTRVIKGNKFRKEQKKVFECVDSIRNVDGKILIKGWCVGAKKTQINLFYEDNPLEASIKYHLRKDVKDCFLEGECEHPTGYEIYINEVDLKKVKMQLVNGGRKTVRNLHIYGEKSTKNYFDMALDYWKKFGFKIMFQKALKKIIGLSKWDYSHWIREREVSKDELVLQRNTSFDNEPLFSIVVYANKPNKKYFKQMIDSVCNQSYRNWELCIAEAGETLNKSLAKIIKKHSNIRYIAHSENINKAIEMVNGDYILLGSQDGIFSLEALFEYAKAINMNPECEFIYSDEDKIDGGIRKSPNFKPDYSPDYLRSNNYIGRFFAFSRSLFEKVGMINCEYDYVFRCCENARQIVHIPKILYSERIVEIMANNAVMGKNVIEAHLNRVGLRGQVIMDEEHSGVYRVIYDLPVEPLVSILIPNKDHIDDLDKCIRSVVKQDYTDFEIIVIENNSTDKETFNYYEKIQKEFDKVKVIYWDSEFNYSAINNFGEKEAKGDYLLLLNNDTEMLKTDCLRELVSYGIRPEVGIVGARLLYGDGTIQHAGVIIGLGGLAGHAFAENEGNDPGYQMRAMVASNLSAVTAACLLVRRSVYNQVGGLEEILKVAFNDVDFCLKVRAAGYLVVYNPFAVLYHYESKSRGLEDTEAKLKRFEDEVMFTCEKWKDIILNGDPYYNVNLTLMKQDFSLRE